MNDVPIWWRKIVFISEWNRFCRIHRRMGRIVKGPYTLVALHCLSSSVFDRMTVVWEFHFGRQKYRNMIETNVKWCAEEEEEEDRNNELFRKWFEAWNSSKNIIWMWVITMENDVCRFHWIFSLILCCCCRWLRYLQRTHDALRILETETITNATTTIIIVMYIVHLAICPIWKGICFVFFHDNEHNNNNFIFITLLWVRLNGRALTCVLSVCVCVFADVVYVIIFSFIHRERQTRRCAELVVYVQRYYIINENKWTTIGDSSTSKSSPRYLFVLWYQSHSIGI